MPERIQRRRSKGSRLPPNTVCVTRPSKWGNPFHVKRSAHYCGWRVNTPKGNFHFSHRDAVACAVYMFRCSLSSSPELEFVRMRADLHELRGKNLACWCPLPKPGEPDMCHAAVLLEAANR